MARKVVYAGMSLVVMALLLAGFGAVATEYDDSAYSPMYLYRYSQNVGEMGLSPQGDAEKEWSDDSINVINLKVETTDLSSTKGDAQPLATTWTSDCRGVLASCTIATSCCYTTCFCS